MVYRYGTVSWLKALHGFAILLVSPLEASSSHIATSKKLLQEAPYTHVEQAHGDTGDACFTTPHAKEGFALQNNVALLLQLRHALPVSVACQTKEDAAACYMESALPT